MRDLPDINVWLALAYEGHLHHESAQRWFEDTGARGSVFSRVTQMGLLRLLTNRAVMREDVLGQTAAWRVYDQLSADERVYFLAEPPDLERMWRRLSRSKEPRTARWTDAYLAAFAVQAELRLVSFDRGFERLKETESLLLR